MSFASKHSDKLWNTIYTVRIPEHSTMNSDFIRKFGVRLTGDKAVDKARHNAFTTAMITVIKMLEYYTEGIEIAIVNRDDMVTIHRDIESYLEEWRSYLAHGMNVNMENHKKLIYDLERFSMDLYDRCKIVEIVIPAKAPKGFNLLSSDIMTPESKQQPTSKPDYDKITDLVRKKIRSNERF